MSKRDEVQRCERATVALYAGQITEGQYLRETNAKWRETAQWLFARWRRKLPAWVEVEDVEQELRMQALKHVRAWQPGRSTGTIGQFVDWCAKKRVQRTFDAWRGVSTSGNSHKRPSRCEVAFSRAFAPEVDPMGRAEPVAAEQEALVEASERFADALGGCGTVREALVLLALRRAGGSPSLAARLLLEDFAARVECELGSEAQARRVVAESVSRIAARLDRVPGPALPPEDLFDWAEECGTTEGPASSARLRDGTDEDRAERAA